MRLKKISAHAVGMAVGAITVWGLKEFADVATPPEVAVAFGTLAAAVVSYIVPDYIEE